MNEQKQENKSFFSNWSEERKKSLYKLMGFGVFFLVLILLVSVSDNHQKVDQNDGKNPNHEQPANTELKETINKELIKNYSFQFTMEIVPASGEKTTYEGKSYENKILATNHINETYYIENDKTYLLDKRSGTYHITDKNIYLVEFRYNVLTNVLAGCTFDKEEETEEGIKRSYHYDTNQITTIETKDTLTIIMEVNGNHITISYYEINQVEDFTIL